MKENDKIKIFAKKKSFSNEDDEDLDLDYWLSVSTKERVDAMFDWNRRVWKTITGVVPNKIEKKSGAKVSFLNLDQDDF